jgi:hypothetical protein
MALEFRDRVADTTTTTGTGPLTLAGSPPAGFRGFSAHTTGATVRYAVASPDNTEWEVNEGIWTASGLTLTRATVFASSNGGSLVNFSAGTKTVTEAMVAASLAAPSSEVWVQGGNGHGSTNTRIRRFTNTLLNTGADITYADSAANGATFTINTDGIYAISYTDVFSGASNIGLSLNSTELTTNINAIAASARIAMATTPAADFALSLGVTLRLAAGDVIRVHTQASGASAAPERAQVRVIRVA